MPDLKTCFGTWAEACSTIFQPLSKSVGTSPLGVLVVGAASYILLNHIDVLLNNSDGPKAFDLVAAACLAVASVKWWKYRAGQNPRGTKIAWRGHRSVPATNTRDRGLLERIRRLRKGPNCIHGGTNSASLMCTDTNEDGGHRMTSEQRMFETDVKEVIAACRDADLELAERLLVQLAIPVENVRGKDTGQNVAQTLAHVIIEACLQAGDMHRAARWVELMHKGGMQLHARSIYVVLGSLVDKAEFRSAAKFLCDLAVAGAPADLACFERVLEQCISLDGPTGLEEWLEQVSRCGSRPASLAYTALIGSPRHVSKVADAEYWLDHACKAGIPVNGQILGAVMCACARAGQDHATQKWFLKMLENSKVCSSFHQQALSFDMPAFRKLMDAFAQRGETKLAQQWFTKIVSEGIIPDTTTFNTVIRAQLRRGELSGAEQWLDYARSHNFALDVFDFNAVMVIAARNEKPEVAERWFHQMANDGVVPDVVSYNAVINAWAKHGNSDRIEALITKMCEDGIEPDLLTLSSAIHAYAKGAQVPRAEALFNQIVARGHVKPDAICYNALIDVSVKSSRIKGATRWLDTMLKEGISPSVVTYTTLLHAHARACDVDAAERVWHNMVQAGIEANVVSYSALINACAKTGIERAETWFNKMIAAGVQANIICYSAVLNVCAKAGNLERAEYWFNFMLEKGTAPNVVCYNNVIDACSKASKPDRATWWLDRLCQDSKQVNSGKTSHQGKSSGCLRPTRQSFTAAAHAHALHGDWETCEKTFADMEGYGISMDEFSVTVLLTSYSRARPRQRERGEKCFRQYVKSGAVVSKPPLRALRSLIGWQRLEQIKAELQC